LKEKIRRTLNCEKQIYQRELLTKFYEIDDFDAFYQNFYENTIATQAFCFLLDFIYQHNPYLVNKISEPKFENCSDRLILANHSLKQLNIVDDHNYTGKYSSVEKMLNVCITSMGKRRFSNRLLNPTTNVDDLNNEYNITEHMLGVGEKYEFLKNKLVVIKDIS
jgi:DNA mismatch repair protein MutS